MAQENLNIVIRAFDKTSAGFRKVRDGLGGISKRVLNVKTAVAALGGSLALQQFSSSIDDIAKQSDRLGITVAQLQSLQFAASQTGTDAGELKRVLSDLINPSPKHRQASAQVSARLKCWAYQ